MPLRSQRRERREAAGHRQHVGGCHDFTQIHRVHLWARHLSGRKGEKRALFGGLFFFFSYEPMSDFVVLFFFLVIGYYFDFGLTGSWNQDRTTAFI